MKPEGERWRCRPRLRDSAPVVAVASDEVAAKPVIDAAATVAAAMPDESRAPRKRRRRRGGKRLAGGEDTAANGNGQDSPGQPRAREARPAPAARPQAASRQADVSTAQEPSLFSRIGTRLRKLVTRAPHNQH